MREQVDERQEREKGLRLQKDGVLILEQLMDRKENENITLFSYHRLLGVAYQQLGTGLLVKPQEQSPAASREIAAPVAGTAFALAADAPSVRAAMGGP